MRPEALTPVRRAGHIEAGDLLVALRSLGFEPRKDEVKKLMSDNDKDNSGKINKQQFVEIFRAKWVSLRRRPLHSPPRLLAMRHGRSPERESSSLAPAVPPAPRWRLRFAYGMQRPCCIALRAWHLVAAWAVGVSD